MNRALGIDPGIERLGWAIIAGDGRKFNYLSSGVKKTSKTLEQSKRLLEIHDFLENLIQEKELELIAIEKVFFSKNVKTALIIGEVRGIILMLASKYKIPVSEFGPSEVKLALAGYGKADKTSVYNMLRLTLQLPHKKILDDESDAIAIACCGVIHKKNFANNF